MAELAQRPLAYSSLVLSLSTLFAEELQIVSTVKKRYPNIEVWLIRGDGLQALLDEAMRLGADGFVSEDGMHRLPPPPEPVAVEQNEPISVPEPEEKTLHEPILTADELRALLDDPPPVF
jgi:hypothetical protein